VFGSRIHPNLGVNLRNILIVANETIGGGELSAAVLERMQHDECNFHLVVPRAPGHPGPETVLSVSPEVVPMVAYDESENRRIAEQQLSLGVEWISQHGATATGEVVLEADTLDVVVKAVKQESVDEVIVSTLHSSLSRLLHLDLPHRIEHHVTVPVTVVTAAQP
jgi:nucleotide-binding universal stress UspA family protein